MIKKLPKEVWSKIQAGEVIDGPSAVIRELIDNSIDANSNNIKILIEDSGLSKIEVEDDGEGITFDDSMLLFTNHATSKISNFDDLNELRTLGFRGEALYSIGSISYVQVKSRNLKEEIGFELIINGGKRILHKKIPFSKGTKISVQKLYFNVPAREKFLENKRKELSNIKEVFFNKAFAGWDRSLTLISDKRTLYEFIKCENIENRINQIYPNIDLSQMSFIDYVEINKKYKSFIENFKISNITIIFSNRSSYSKNRTIFHFSFNKRSASNEDLLKRIKGFYSNYLPRGFYPYFFMEIEMDPMMIDCNVHPAKKNIKINQQNNFISFIIQIIDNKLKESQFSFYNIKDENFISNIDILNKEYDKKNNKEKAKILDENFGENYNSSENDLYNEIGVFNESIKEDESDNNFFNKEENINNISFKKDRIIDLIQNGKYHGQIFETYLIFENKNCLLIVDQHAADERISYNILIENINKKRRILLFPKVIDLLKIDEEEIEKIIDLFDNAGIEMTRIGKNKIQIFAIPQIVPSIDEDNFINETIDFIANEFKSIRIELKDFIKLFYSHIIAKSACHLAIKQGDILTEFEAKNLCKKLFDQDSFEKCPHGRPTFFIIDKDNFEKIFLRKK
ncbi:MAG TPA: DNA mismatch repair endonuclease MutL [Exilispira sp.]|nr:DNA mismatch repair endonuclease MutL [Exilispira sp.]